jgi:hypothetical protein
MAYQRRGQPSWNNDGKTYEEGAHVTGWVIIIAVITLLLSLLWSDWVRLSSSQWSCHHHHQGCGGHVIIVVIMVAMLSSS